MICEYGLPYGNIYVTIPPLTGVRVAEYLNQSGRSSFRRGFDDREAVATAQVSTALERLRAGNFSNVKGGGNSKWGRVYVSQKVNPTPV